MSGTRFDGLRRGVMAAALLLASAVTAPPASAPLDLGNGQVRILGTSLDISPQAQTVPVGVPTRVDTRVAAPPGSIPATVTVRAELTGPGIAGSLPLSAEPNGAFLIPAQSVRGTYALSNIRLMDGASFLSYSAHRDASITVTDILIAQVTSRPLTYQEMIDKGIVVSSKNFRAYSFVFALEIQSRLQEFEVPIVFPEFGPPILPSIPRPVGNTPVPEFFSPPQVRSVQWSCADLAADVAKGLQYVKSALGPLELPCGFTLQAGQNGGGEPPPDTRPVLLSLLLIPGDVAFLNQFFSLSVLVQNGAPNGSNLRLENITAKASLPPALRGAETNPPTNFSDPVPIVDPGPDGVLGTADDVTFLLAQSVGKAEFLVEGLNSGRWDVPIDLRATLTGLPAGPVPLKGSTVGSVLVRNPSFFVTLDHPDVIRTGETYTISATVTNTSAVPANQVSVKLDKAFLTGADLLSAETVALGDLAPGDSAVTKFQLSALRTGRVTSDAFFGTGALSGSVVLHAGVGELSVPLSPDTLVFPRSVDQLPASLVDPARRLLGLAWSIAKSPNGQAPAGLPQVGEQATRWRVDDLILSARHKSLGEAESTALSDFLLGWLNAGAAQSTGFDRLRRASSKGAELAAAWGQQLTLFWQQETPFDYQKRIARALADRSFLSAVVSTGSDPLNPSARLALSGKVIAGRAQLTSGEAGFERTLPSAELFRASKAGAQYEAGFIGSPDAGGYQIQIAGKRSDNVTLTVSYPGAAGKLVFASFGPFPVVAGSVAFVDIIPGVDPSQLTLQGTNISPLAGSIQLDPRPGLQLVAAVQDLSADPRGHAISLLFNRAPSPESAADKAKYEIRSSFGLNPTQVVAAQARWGDPRRVIVGVANRPSPYTIPTVSVAQLLDSGLLLQAPDPQIVNLDVRDRRPGGSVEGVVIGANGQPLPNAAVVLRMPEISDTTGQTFLSDFATATADAAGKFFFEYVQIRQGQVFQLSAADPVTGFDGEAYGQITTEAQKVTLNIVLLGRGDVEGKVVDETGAAIANAYVTAESVFFKGNRNRGSLNSAADGSFSFKALPVGPVQLWAIDPVTRKTAYQVAAIPNAGGKVTQNVVIMRTARGSISGDVIHELSRRPAAGLYVVAYGEPVAVPYPPGTDRKYFGYRVTDSDGRFSFADVEPGADLIQVYDFSRSSVPVLEYTLTILPDTETVLHLVELDPQAKFGSIEGHVQLKTSGTLTPLANALVSVSDSPVRALTDSTGRYRLDAVPIGARKVSVIAPSPQSLQTQSATVQEGLVLTLDFVFTAAVTGPRTVRGSVFDPLGRPVPGAGVAEFDSSGNVIRSGVTDASGNYVIANVPPGVHLFSALGQDSTSGTLRDDIGAATVNLDGLSDASLTIQLLGFGTVQGKVVGNHLNEVGNPIDSPVVARLTLSAGRLVRVGQFGFIAAPGSPLYLGDAALDSSASDGTYSFSYVLGGSYQLSVHHPIYGDKSASGALGAAQIATHDFRYDNALAWIDGFLFDQNGAPIAGADVDLWQGAAPSTRTDPARPPYATVKTISDPADPRGLGYFRFISLPNSTFVLAFQGVVNGVPRFDQAYVNVGRNPQAIRVTLRTRVVQDVRVTIQQPDGNGDLQPVALAALWLQETDWPGRTFRGSTDSSGIALFAAVSEGRFTINAQKIAAAGSTGGCVCADGGTVNVTLILPGTGSVKGTVRFPGTNAPAASAQVLLWSGGIALGAAQTDANGQYQIDGIELNRRFAVRVKDAASARSGFGSDFVLSANGEIATRDVTLLALGSVQGRFTDAAGVKGIAGATVTLTSESLLGSTVFYSGTDADGNFTFAGIPQGGYRISSQDPLTRLSGSNSGQIELEGLAVTTGLRAQAAGAVDVSVSDAAGAALSIPPIVTLSVPGMPPRTIIASTFRFTDVPVGSIFTIRAEEQASPPRRRAVVTGRLTANGELQSFALRWVPYGSVNVHVIRSGTGADVTRGSVAIYNEGVYSAQFPFDQWVQVNTQGRGQFVAVGGGPLTARYWDPVTRRTTAAAGQLSTEGSTIEITITVPDLVDVTGRVMKPPPASAEPAPGTDVTLDGRTVVTGADGRFLLDGTAAGSHSVAFRNDALAGRLTVPVSLTASSPTFDMGDVVLDGAKPSIVQLTPPDGTTNILRTQPVQILFSKPIRAADGNSIQAVASDHFRYGFISLSSDRRTLYWSPAGGFAPGTTYRFHVGTDAIADDAGWPLDFVWNSTFTTIDDRGPARPVVTQTAPIANAVQVPGTTTVAAIFDSAIDPASIVPGTIVVEKTRPAAAAVSGAVAPGVSAFAVVFTPSAPLEVEAAYKVTVSGLRNTLGTAMSEPYAFSFSTTDNTSPSVTFDPAPAQFYTGGNYLIGLSWTSDDIQSIQVKINGYDGPTFHPAPSDRAAKFTDYVRDALTPRVLAATPKDFSGNTGATVRISVPVVVDARPSVSIQITSATSLPVGGTLTGQIVAADDRGLSSLYLTVSGPLWGSFNWADVAGLTSATRTFSLPVPNSAAAGGTVTLEAYASDNSDSRQSSSVTNTAVSILRDTVPPTIANVSPAGGANVSAGGLVVVSADLTDNIGIWNFTSNGVGSYGVGAVGNRWSLAFRAPSTTGPFSVVLTATDIGQNTTAFTLPLNSVTDNPPAGTITITPAGSILPNNIFTARADATDDHGLKSISLRATGADCVGSYPSCGAHTAGGTASSAQDDFRIKADAAAGSTVSVFADIEDAQGHTATVGPTNITVAADTTPPTLSSPKPDPSATISSGQAVTISVTANDDVEVVSVDLTVDGFSLPIQKISDWTCYAYQSCFYRIHWDASYRAKAVSSPTIVPIRFTAHDRAGNTGTLDHQITISPLAGAAAPAVAMSCPTDGALLPAGYTTTVSAATTDDGLVQRVEFYRNTDTAPFFTSTSPPWQTTYTIPAALPAGAAVTLRARSYDYANHTSDSQAVVTVVAGTVISTDTVILAGNTSYDGQTVIIRGGTTTIAGSHPFANLVVLSGARITSDPSSSFTVSTLDLTRVAGKIYVGCGGSIDVTGKGYLGGRTPGNSSDFGRTVGNVAGTPPGIGGSHGGLGFGADQSQLGSTGQPGITYDSPFDPSDAGAGAGGGGYAGTGGGRAKLAASSVIVDGQVLADGESAYNTGGAGGSIRVDSAIFSGGGTVEAKGGTSDVEGGGGRIAVYADWSRFSQARLIVRGGLRQNDYPIIPYPLIGGAGTVYLKSPAATFGELFSDNSGKAGKNSPLVAIGSGTLTSVAGSTISDSTKTFSPSVAGLYVEISRSATAIGTYLVSSASGSSLTLVGTVTGIQVGDTYKGLMRLDRLTVRNGANLTTTDAIEAATLSGLPNAAVSGVIQARQVRGTTLSLDAEKLSNYGGLAYSSTALTRGAVLSIYGPSALGNTTIDGGSTLSGNAPITAGTLSLTGGSLMTHDAATDTSETRLDITTSGAMTIDATSTVDVSKRGYTTGHTVGNVLTPNLGWPMPGIYGGLGGGPAPAGYSSLVYGSFADPKDLGTGASGRGGGSVHLAAASLSLRGSILADGEGFTDRPARGGAGGSVRIDAPLAGSGSISATGGIGNNYVTNSGYVSGAGGGGRIAVYGDTAGFDRSKIRARGGTGPYNGGAGTVYYKSPAQSFGELVVDNGYSGPATPLPAVGSGTITGVAAATITDSAKTFPYSVYGLYVKVSRGASTIGTYRVIGQSGGTLTLDQTVQGTVLVGDTYKGLLRLDSLVVGSGSSLQTPDLYDAHWLSLNPEVVNSAGTSFGTLWLSGPAPAGGAVYALSSSNTSVATVPASITIPSGATSANFTVTVLTVSSPVSVAISATGGGLTKSVILTVLGPGVLSSLTLYPALIIGGGLVNGTVTLTGGAPVGGAVVALSSSNTAAVTVPSSVTVAAGTTTATFTANTLGVSSASPATVTASYAGVSKTASLTVNPASLWLLSVTGSIRGGNSGDASVSLDGSAPPGGAAVTLASSDSSTASVPASVTVPAGATSASFTITTVAVSTSRPITFTAAYSGVTRTAGSSVDPAALKGFSLNPATLTGGVSSTGTVTLDGKAAAGGALVTLTSSDPTVATVASSVTIPAGSSSASFTVATVAAAVERVVLITAQYGGTAGVNLTVKAPALYDFRVVPFGVVGGNTATGTVTLTGIAPAGGSLVTLSSSNTSVATVPGSVTVPAGVSTAAFTVTTTVVSSPTPVTISAIFANVTRTDSISVKLAPPAVASVTLTPASLVGGNLTNLAITLSSAAPAGGADVNLSSSDASLVNPGLFVSMPAGTTMFNQWLGTKGVATSTAVTISAVTTGAAKTATVTLAPSALSSVSLSPTALVGGASATGTVTLTGSGPAGGAAVSLSSSNTAVATVPATATVSATSSTATFAVTTVAVAAQTTVTISAVYAGVTKTASLTVNPPPPSVASLTLSPASVVGGTASTGTVTLSAAAPVGGSPVSLTSSNTSVATMPATLTVPAGATTATFNVTTLGVASPATVTISATASGAAKTATLTVNPAALSSVSVDPAIVVGGTNSILTVTLTGSAPPGGAAVAVSSSNTSAATAGPTATVAFGAATAQLTIPTFSVASSTSVTITGVYSGVTKTASLTVNPPTPAVSSVTFSPSSVAGGSSSTGTVTLMSAAYTGGAVATLSSSNISVATVPATTTVPAGSTSATFPVSTRNVASSTTVTISAVTTGAAKTGTLTVTPCAVGNVAPPASFPAGETIWVDDQIPAGSTLYGSWTWDTTQKASGTQSHTEPAVAGEHYHGFDNAWSQNLYIQTTDKLITYVLLDPCDPPQEVLLQWDVGGLLVRAFWGADRIAWGTLGVDRFRMGPLPATGQWVRLEVPASTLNIGGRIVGNMTFALYDGHAWFDRTGVAATCSATVAPAPTSFSASDTVWLDDALPAGATTYGGWIWDTSQKAAGTQSHTDPQANGTHYHGVDNLWPQNLYVEATDKLVAYALLDPCDPPQEVLLQWDVGGLMVRAFWGADLIAWGTLGVDRFRMGPLPATGQWVRLEVPASTLGIGGRTVGNMAFALYSGHAWFDRIGKTETCRPASAPAPSSLPPDTVWFDDGPPAGATVFGTMNWDTAQKASGTQSNTEPAATGMHQHGVQDSWTNPMAVGVSDRLVVYALIDPCDPPQELMLQWNDGAGGWEHRAFWGADLISWGVAGTASRASMGPLPATGQWVRLEIPASTVGLAGKTVSGIAFTLYDGHAWFDRVGKGAGATFPSLSSLTITPAAVSGGASATGTATLTAAAPAGGQSVALSSSDAAAASVPGSISVPAGSTSVTFTVTTYPVAADRSVTVTGTSGTATKIALLSVTATPPALAEVAVSPPSVASAGSATGTVTLTLPASAGGITVSLSSSNTGAISVPSSVVVPAGAISATFAATAGTVTSSTTVTVTGTYAAVNKTATITIAPPGAALSSVSLSPASVTGGASSTGTATLTAAAPTGGAIVYLSSSDGSAVTVPASVTVAAGATTAAFTATTLAVASTVTATITATYASVPKTASLTVNPAALSSVTLSPSTVVGGTSATGTVTLTGSAPAAGAVVALSSSNTAAATVPASVVAAAGATTATFTATTLSVASTTSVTITAVYSGVTKTAVLTVNPAGGVALSSVTLAPASVVGGNASTGTVTLTGAAPGGGAVVTLSSSNTSAATVPASVTVAAGTTTVTFTVGTSGVAASTAVTITAVYSGVTKTATLTVTPAALTSVTLVPASVVGGNPSTATVTLTGKAATGGLAVTLSSSNTAAATVPASVTVAASASTATFTVTTLGVASSTSATITGVAAGVTKTATLTVTPAALSSLTLSPTAVVGSNSSTGTVTLTGKAAAGGALVTLTSSNTSVATVPASVTVSAGSSTATFIVTTLTVASSTNVTITAVYSGVTKTAALAVNPAGVALSAVSLAPASVVGGNLSTGTVTLASAAPAGGTVVTLSSSNTAAATVPASVTVAVGATTATFTVTTAGVTASTSVTITGVAGGVTKTAILTVTRAALSAASAAPANLVGGNTSTGTVTLTGKAPAGGALVTLSSSNTAAATVPASVTVAAGASTATFTVTTLTVSSAATVTISAVYAGVTKTATVTVNPASALALSSVSVLPAVVIGGNSSTGTVTLSVAAPAGGTVVTLASNNAAAMVPASVTVAAGASTATFAITTSVVTANQAVTIMGTYSGVSKTAILTVKPLLASVAISPAVVVGGMVNATGTVTLNAAAPAGGTVVTLSSSSVAASVPGSVTVLAGATTASFAVTTGAVTVNVAVTITASYAGASPKATLTVQTLLGSLVLSQTSVIGGYGVTGTVALNLPAPAGGTVVTLTSSVVARAVVPASVTVPAGSTVATFGIQTLPASSSGAANVTAGNAGASKVVALTTTPSVAAYSLTLDPTAVFGTATSTGTVTLNGPAPTGGAVVTLSSSNTSAATVPASTTVAAGATSGAFTVTTLTVAASTNVTISAAYGGVTKTATQTVAPALQAYSVTLSPMSVVRGATSTATAMLNGPAPTGGAVVTLTSSSTANATVPANVTVAAGARSAPFTVTTLAGGAAASVNVSGVYGGATKTGALALTSAAVPYSLTFSPASIAQGASTTATVTLNGAAPAGGTVVTLSSSNAGVASPPASVTVAAGATSATFSLTAQPVASATNVLVFASSGGVTASGTLTVLPALPTAVTLAPVSVVAGGVSIGTVTLSGPAPSGGSLVALASANPAVASVPATTSVAGNATSASFTVTGLNVSASAAAAISATREGVAKSATVTVTPAAISSVTVSPTSIVGGNGATGAVTLTGSAPAGGAVVTLSSSNTAAATVPASVTVAANATTATFTVTTLSVASTTSVTITAVYSGVTKTAALAVNPAGVALSAVSLAPASVVGGNPSTGTVTLTAAAPSGGTTVTLSSSNTSAATVPASVTVAAGATTATFTVTTLGVAASTSVTITGVGGGVTKTATLTVTPAALSAVSLAPSNLVGGNPSTGTVTLTGKAQPGGAVITLSSSNTAAATVPASVTVAAGATSVTFTVTTLGVASTVTPTITATYASVPKTATLTVTPAALSSVSLAPATVVGGNASTGTVTLTGKAQPGGAVVTLSSSNTAAVTVPASVTVAAGATSATFTVTTLSVASSTTVTISGVYSGVTKTATLAVNPAGPVAPPTTDLTEGNAAAWGSFAQDSAATSVADETSQIRAGAKSLRFDSASGFLTGLYYPNTPGSIHWDLTRVHYVSFWAYANNTNVGGFQQGPTLVVKSAAGSFTYDSPPTPINQAIGAWRLYQIPLEGNSVWTRTAAGTPTLADVLQIEIDLDTWGSTFTVYFDGLQFLQSLPGDLAEANASLWGSFAPVDLAATSVADDTTHVMVGAKSIRFDTASGFDTGVRYPSAGNAHWDLTGADTLNFWAYAINANAGGFQDGQPNVVLKTTGGTYTYTAVGNLMTIDAWHLYQIPLAGGAPWTMTTSGSPTMADVNQIEIHQDTWGGGFTIYYDGLTFGGPTVGLGLTPANIVGGGSGSASVTLSVPAPAGGTAVTLSSSNSTVASIPGSVTVAAGATSAIVPITTTAVASSTAVTLTVVAGTTRTAVLTVVPVGIAGVRLSSATVAGGGTSTGTITLSGNAPAGGATVWLASGDPAAGVPASITVPAGASTATFTVTTVPVGISTLANISAVYAGTSAGTTITVTP